MANKRVAEVMDAPSSAARRHSIKRTRVLSAKQRSDSSARSSAAISEDAAMQSTPSASGQPSRHSSFSSMQPSVEDDSGSGLSSSSEEPSDSEDDSGEEVITIGGPKKPEIGKEGLLGGASDLQARISALLPQLAAANRELEKEGQNHSIEVVQDGEQHIEMDLGLGVLEEQRGDEDSSDSTSDDADEAEVPGDISISSDTERRKPVCKETSAMCKLMGQSKDRKKAGIEDLG
ncbi:hypothetical protein EJ03DRAFT_352880 [Teratosphaeria nubilosa]|uniref:Uncharacterized protein n=1 Tax=Teratosphaeria nubilosa TaxID=161662 RepID=A0A6G1L484_9PEZI|nr:hypothetical protein EJ03DRAFT_352880 [Teratosphaeria nubilosa]